MNVLITGGTGYIGSITSLQFLNAGHQVVIVDNLCNSHTSVADRIAKLAGTAPVFVQADVRDRDRMETLLKQHRIDAVIHLAGLKAVGESTQKPLAYYDNNVVGSQRLLEAMKAAAVRTLVFSSSATVYAPSEVMPLAESAPLAPASPYGRSKWMVEQMLSDLHQAEPGWSITALRYFNPVGAHPSGSLGEDPKGIPNNLMPYIAQVAIGRHTALRVFGDDYPTPDGTGVRDYIHVMDLAAGHLAACEHAQRHQGFEVYNLGGGRGYSVLEMLKAFSQACGKELPYAVQPRRAGDLAAYWADASKARSHLGWSAQLGIEAMCADAWRWQEQNPQGYAA